MALKKGIQKGIEFWFFSSMHTQKLGAENVFSYAAVKIDWSLELRRLISICLMRDVENRKVIKRQPCLQDRPEINILSIPLIFNPRV
jgi:hypothetical protein